MRCVMGWRPCDAVAVARDAGIGWVLVDEHIYRVSWRLPPIHGAPAQPWAGLRTLPWLTLAYQKGDVWLWRVGS